MKGKTVIASLLGTTLAAPVVPATNNLVKAVNTRNNVPDNSGFLNPNIISSYGGNAVCVQGIVPIETSAMTLKLNVSADMNELELTQLVLSESYANTTTFEQIVGSMPRYQNVSGTFNISAQICFPAQGQQTDNNTIQILTHGFGFGGSYWDFGVNTSYIDNAAQSGQITFSYDRLGIGNSSHPDPINTLQDSLHIAILHKLIVMLRSSDFSKHSFSKVIGVGHSFGSAVTYSVARQYPADLDAVVLTGYSTNMTNSNQFTSAVNILSAAKSFPDRFGHLQPGYLVPTSKYGMQYAFLHYPNFAEDVYEKSFATVETQSLGEQFSGAFFGGVAANYTGPAYIVNGEHDISFCDGNCYYPVNILDESLKQALPNAAKGSGSFILPDAGHGINLHRNANEAFNAIQAWIKSVGF